MNFDNVTSLKINGKDVQTLEMNGRQVFADSIYKKLKLNLGSSFSVVGIANGVVAGYTINGDTYTCKTYDLDTGEELTSFDYSFSSEFVFKIVRVFWAESNYAIEGSEFIFCFGYYSTSTLTPSWYWYAFHEDGYQIWSAPGCGSGFGCVYDTSTQTYKIFAINISGKVLSVQAYDLGGYGYSTYSYTVLNQYVTQIEVAVTAGNMIMLRCDNTQAPSYPNYYSVLWDCSNAITTNIWEDLASVKNWTDYGANSGYWLMLGNGTYYLFKNTSLINPVQIDGDYFPLAFGASDSVVYLYKSSEHAIYKLQSGTYTKLGGTASTFSGGLLDDTKQYMADTSGKIYYFDAL